MRSKGLLVLSALLVAAVAGCGAASTGVQSNLTSTGATSTSAMDASSSGSMPCCFVTIQCTVTQVLPDDTNGYGHQRFDVQETDPDPGYDLEVDNDETYGTEVPNLQVGDDLTIRGIEYHDPGKNGIHWTHHDNVDGDAGYIETADGTIYQ